MILILFLCTLAIGLLAQWHVKRPSARHSGTPVQSGYAGAGAAHEILRQAGITNVSIIEYEDPRPMMRVTTVRENHNSEQIFVATRKSI